MANDDQNVIAIPEPYIRLVGPANGQVYGNRRVHFSGFIHPWLVVTPLIIYKLNADGSGTPLGVALVLPTFEPDPENPGALMARFWGSPTCPVGTYQVYAESFSGTVDPVRSEERWITVEDVLGLPIISFPQEGETYPRSIAVRGRMSETPYLGVTVKIYLDQATHPIRETQMGSLNSWSVDPFDFQPGRLGIVAEAWFEGKTSGKQDPVSFDVRPPTLENVKFESVADSRTVKFSAQGYPGATVEIRKISGPDAPMPAAVPVASGGQWEATANNWPFGTYRLQALQKVGDGASGWINSEPLEFTVDKGLPDVTEVAGTIEYQPVFSGKGVDGATVIIMMPGTVLLEAPEVQVSNGRWHSQAFKVWGPTPGRSVQIKQRLDGEYSPNWVKLELKIPPLAPGLKDPVEDGLSPKFSGTCWSGAVVNIRFSDNASVHKASVNGGNWTFQRTTDFAEDTPHTIHVLQVIGTQTSEETSKTFTVSRLVLQPTIIRPEAGSKIARVVTIEGENGMAGARMQLWDVQFGVRLGEAVDLIAEGDWSIDLSMLEFRLYTLKAQQTLNGRPSPDSASRTFEVVLLPPQITQPEQGSKLPRIARLKGTGMVGGRVDVFQQGVADPLLANIPVLWDGRWLGRWEGDVTLPAGRATIWARQTFIDEKGKLQTSANTEPSQFDVVPLPPFIETPGTGEHVGRRVVVSGFGVPGDTVTVTLGAGTQSAVVADDRSWSVAVDAGELAGRRALQAKAAWKDFESEPEEITVELCTYQPLIEEPATGHWLTNPLVFSGKGRAGVGHVVSWYNPDLKLSAPLPVVGEQWRGESDVQLSAGGHWYRFRQDLKNDPDGVTSSDWVESGRFEVMPHPLSES